MIDSNRYAIIYRGPGNPVISGKYTKIKPLIKSRQLNHSLLSSLYTKNYDNDIIIGNQLAYGHLSYQLIAILSELGTFQFGECDNINDEVEYYSLLDSIEVVSINLEDIYNINSIETLSTYIGISERYPTLESDVNWTLLSSTDTQSLKVNSLLMIVSSSDKITSISDDIHNRSITPHQNFDNLVLFEKDLNNNRKIIFLDENLIETKSKIRLGDYTEPEYGEVTTDTVNCIYDANDDKYIIELNGNLVCKV
jgi:hypothetical protein